MIKGIILTGPTASGKSRFAITMAKKINGEIVNCDSRQIYKELPIISAQPSTHDMEEVPHHLYGHKTILDNYSVGHWLKEVEPVIKDILHRGKTPIVVGGTGLYVNALYNGISEIPDVPKEYVAMATQMLHEIGYDSFHKKLQTIDNYINFDKTNTQRMIRAMSVYLAHNKPLSYFHKTNVKILPDICWNTLLLSIPREEIYNNCNTRFIEMWNSGVIEEIQSLIDTNIPSEHYVKSIGIAEIVAYIQGKIKAEEAINLVQQKTRNYAKRQITWFKNKSPFLKHISP